MDILNEIKTFSIKHKLLNKNSHFLIGFSGGADSMLLLYCLRKLQDTYKFRLSALHINHNWRGKESDNEAKNCENFCKEFGINFYCETLNDEIKKDENSARIARYDLFNQYAKQLSATAILTAHNSTDVVETFIYRLAKGMGTEGALSIPEKRPAKHCNIYRPLINISSKDIRKQCKEFALDYNVDSSNFNNKYKRNLIRNEILPKLEKINPDFENSVLSFIENLKSNNKLLEETYAKDYDKVIVSNKILTPHFIEFGEDIQRVIIYKFLKSNDIEPQKDLILRLIHQIIKNSDKPNGKKYSIKNQENSSENISFFCSKEECYIIGINNFINSPVIFENEFKEPLKQTKYSTQKIPQSSSKTAIVNKNAIVFPLELRTRKAGDVIQPFSHKSKIKLKDYFIEKNIPEHKRNEILLLCKGLSLIHI